MPRSRSMVAIATEYYFSMLNKEKTCQINSQFCTGLPPCKVKSGHCGKLAEQLYLGLRVIRWLVATARYRQSRIQMDCW